MMIYSVEFDPLLFGVWFVGTLIAIDIAVYFSLLFYLAFEWVSKRRRHKTP